MKSIALLAVSVSALAAAACGGDNPAQPQPTAADVRLTLSTVGGVTSAPCFSDVRVQAAVTDRRQRPVKDYLVNFRPTQGGGSMYAGSGLTGSNGIARDIWTLGPIGPHVLEARSVDPATGDPRLHGTLNVMATVGSNASNVIYPSSGGTTAVDEHTDWEMWAYDGCGASPGQPRGEVPYRRTVSHNGSGSWEQVSAGQGLTLPHGGVYYLFICHVRGADYRVEVTVGDAATGGEVTTIWTTTCSS